MDILLPPADRGQGAGPWAFPEDYVKEERAIQPIRRLVLKGPINVVFRRCTHPQLVVAGKTDKAVSQVLITTGQSGRTALAKRSIIVPSFSASSVTT